MKIEGVPFQQIDWASVPVKQAPGETGRFSQRFFEQGNLRVRLVEYSPGYKADHWCTRGHVIHVLEGILITELQDGRSFTTHAGSTYVVQDGDSPHRSHTHGGAKMFVVD